MFARVLKLRFGKNEDFNTYSLWLGHSSLQDFLEHLKKLFFFSVHKFKVFYSWLKKSKFAQIKQDNFFKTLYIKWSSEIQFYFSLIICLTRVLKVLFLLWMRWFYQDTTVNNKPPACSDGWAAVSSPGVYTVRWENYWIQRNC